MLFVVNENENGCCECFLNLSEQGLRAVCEVVLEVVLLGSLSNNDGDGNENGKKAIGLDSVSYTHLTLPTKRIV